MTKVYNIENTFLAGAAITKMQDTIPCGIAFDDADKLDEYIGITIEADESDFANIEKVVGMFV